MRNIIVVLALLICGLMLAPPPPCFALVIGSGDISFSLGTSPDNTSQTASFSVSDNPGSFINGPSPDGTVTNGHSISTISISSNSFSFSAQAPSAGITGVAQADLYTIYTYGAGSDPHYLSTLPAFSYTYNLNGQVDSSNDVLSLMIQLEVYYQDPDTGQVILYSDYDPNAPEYRTKFVSFSTPDQNGQISQTGTVSFGPFEAGKDVRWRIRCDLMGNGYDQLPGGGNPVPIPGTILLFAPGLAGIAVLRRRLKK